jgi:chorismate mutase
MFWQFLQKHLHMMSLRSNSLQSNRNTIENIDDKIFNLLQKRACVVHKVSILKQKTKDKLFIKPLREAELLSKLNLKLNTCNKINYNRHFYTHLQRYVISASNQLEQDFCLGILTESSLANAMLYYGAFCKFKSYQEITEALNAIMNNQIQVLFITEDTRLSKDIITHMQSASIKIFAETKSINDNFTNNYILGSIKFTKQEIINAKYQIICNESTEYKLKQIDLNTDDNHNCIGFIF